MGRAWVVAALLLSACAFEGGSETEADPPSAPPASEMPPDPDAIPETPVDEPPADDPPATVCDDPTYGTWMNAVFSRTREVGDSLEPEEEAELEALVKQRPCPSASIPLYGSWIQQYDQLLADHDDEDELDSAEAAIASFALAARPAAEGDVAVQAFLDVHDSLRRRLDDFGAITSSEATLLDALSAGAPRRSGASGYQRWLVSFDDAYDEVDSFGIIDPWERTILDAVVEVAPCVHPDEVAQASAAFDASGANRSPAFGYDAQAAAPATCITGP